MLQDPNRASNDSGKQGMLQIGDQWNAINIIAQSQTHPLRAICELVENAIDARAKSIQIIRRRKDGAAFLEISDDGEGIPRSSDGTPDFARMATHICDSMKRHFDHSQRQGIHGEFGIGLLSFWSLGEEIRIRSLSNKGHLFEMRMVRSDPTYTVRQISNHMFHDGTLVSVGPLLETTRSVVTGEKIQRYLAAQLRDRLTSTGVEISISDRVARKNITVEPRQFDGDRLEEAKTIPTPLGDVIVELYLQETPKRDSAVALCKDGTRVLENICELPQLDQPPWNDSRLTGMIDFEPLHLAPGTRSGVVPDQRLVVLLESLAELQPVVIDAIEAREQANSEKANRQMLLQLQRAFVDAIQAMPENDYVFIDIPKAAAPKSSRSKRDKAKIAPCGLPVPRSFFENNPDPVSPAVEEMSDEPGPMENVTILPRNGRAKPAHACRLRAIPRDQHGRSIREDVKVRWQVIQGAAEISEIDTTTCEITSDATDDVTVEVVCRKGRKVSKDRVVVSFTESEDVSDGAIKGLPSYRCDPAQGVGWRSRYDATGNEIVINSAHRDFINSRSKSARHRRYIGKLYAKEIVLMNFPHESPEGAMERLVEIMLRTEEALA